MATDWKYHGKNEYGIDAPCRITGATAQVGALTVTGAVTVNGLLTSNAGIKIQASAVAANGTLGAEGVYVFNGANGAVHLPAVATYDGYRITLLNINGTGTVTLTASATDNASIIWNSANHGTDALITPNLGLTLYAYSTGTAWIGV